MRYGILVLIPAQTLQDFHFPMPPRAAGRTGLKENPLFELNLFAQQPRFKDLFRSTKPWGFQLRSDTSTASLYSAHVQGVFNLRRIHVCYV